MSSADNGQDKPLDNGQDEPLDNGQDEPFDEGGPIDAAQDGPEATTDRSGDEVSPAPDGGPAPDVDAEFEDITRDLSGDGSEDVLADLAEAQQALAERTADLQRLQAEFLNYKRRVDRDRELVKQNATYQALSAMLPVLDDIDRAREHGELEGGFKAIGDSLERIVAGLGLVKFGKPGDEFDPRMHEALMHAHSADVTTTTCDAVVQAGYRVGERVVRPARVTVVDPEPAGESAGDDAE